MNSEGKLLIFVATYNEAENVEPLFNQIRQLDLDADILFLDDNSPDGTGAIIDRIAAGDPRVHTLHRSGKQGIGSAHATGIAWAYGHGYRNLVTMDCDFTHSPADIVDFLAQAGKHDIVVGSRYMQKGSLRSWNLLRKTLTHVGHLLTTNLLGMPYDATGAFRLYRLDRIPAGVFELVYSSGYSFFFESLFVCWLNGASIHEIPIELPARTYGSSKMAWRDALRSTALLAHLFVKTRIDSRALLYAEPFATAEKLEPTTAQREWDAYWDEKKKPGALIYDLIAAFYRKFIIKPSLNHFALKHFSPRAEVLHAGLRGWPDGHRARADTADLGAGYLRAGAQHVSKVPTAKRTPHPWKHFRDCRFRFHLRRRVQPGRHGAFHRNGDPSDPRRVQPGIEAGGKDRPVLATILRVDGACAGGRALGPAQIGQE